MRRRLVAAGAALAVLASGCSAAATAGSGAPAAGAATAESPAAGAPAAGGTHGHAAPTGSSAPLGVGERFSTLTVPRAYTPRPPNGGTDEYRCFLVDPGLRAPAFLTGSQFRPGNVDRRVPGLVFAGSGTQPGVGIPMVLVSGKLAAQRVQEYAGTARPLPRTVVR